MNLNKIPLKQVLGIKPKRKDIPETQMQSPERLFEMNDANPMFQTLTTPPMMSGLQSARMKIGKETHMRALEPVAEKTHKNFFSPVAVRSTVKPKSKAVGSQQNLQ